MSAKETTERQRLLRRWSELNASTNTVRNDLLANLEEDKEYRELFVSEHINRTVAFQIRATREAQEMKQADLGEQVDMAQGRISLLEDANYGNFTIKTLKRIANALDVALVVRFVPFTQLVTWVAGEPQIIPGLSSESVAVPKFATDIAEMREKEKTRTFNGNYGDPTRIRPGERHAD